MLLTIDIGTSNLKSALWNIDEGCNDGLRYCFASVPLSPENDGFKHETNPSLWLAAFKNACDKMTEDNKTRDGKKINLKDIKAIVISGNGPSLVSVFGEPVFKNENIYVPAENARLWLDSRAAKYSGEISALMGGYVDASFFLPKIFFIKNEEKTLYDKTKYFIGCPEYLAFALTGEAKTVFPCEGFDRWFWNDEILNKLDMNNEKFPPFIKPGDQFGIITSQASEYFGFTKNIPVISGGPDFYAAILGSGVKKPGQVCDRSGSSEGINLCTNNRINDKRLMSYGHPVKPFWNLSGIINTTGKAIEWACNVLGFSNFDEFIFHAEKSGPGSGNLIFIPYLAGERAPVWNPSAKALWHGINLSSTRGDFANSILEGISFAVNDVIEIMEESGIKAMELRVTGGLAGCDILNQIKADITGAPVLEGVYKEAELLGLAIIGACHFNYFSSYEEASLAMCRAEKCYEPNLKNTAVYKDLSEKYKKLRSMQLITS